MAKLRGKQKWKFVRIDKTVKNEIENIGKKKESYSDIIRRLLDSLSIKEGNG